MTILKVWEINHLETPIDSSLLKKYNYIIIINIIISLYIFFFRWQSKIFNVYQIKNTDLFFPFGQRHICNGFLADVVHVLILSNRSYGCKVLSLLGSGTTPPHAALLLQNPLSDLPSWRVLTSAGLGYERAAVSSREASFSVSWRDGWVPACAICASDISF